MRSLREIVGASMSIEDFARMATPIRAWSKAQASIPPQFLDPSRVELERGQRETVPGSHLPRTSDRKPKCLIRRRFILSDAGSIPAASTNSFEKAAIYVAAFLFEARVRQLSPLG